MTQDLIERLEKAEAGARELDGFLAVKFGLGFDPPRFTASLDDALALAERVCPDHHSSVGNLPVSGDADYEEHHNFGALLYSRYTKPYDALGHGATRALAVCIAILRAHREGEGER